VQNQLAGDLDGGGNSLNNVGAVETGELSGSYPSNVRAISSGSVVASIDPGTTATPIQDGIDAVNNQGNGRGRIWIPDGIDTPGGLSGYSYTDLLGYHQRTVVNHTDDTQPFMVVDGERECNLHNLKVQGPGTGAGQQSAIRWDQRSNAFNMGVMQFTGYAAGTNGVLDMRNGSPWMSDWGYIRLGDSTGDGFVCEDGGPLTRVGMLETYLNDQSKPLRITGGAWRIGQVNIGAYMGRVQFFGGSVEIGEINLESKQGIRDYPIWIQNQHPLRLWHVYYYDQTPSVNTAVRLDNGSENPGGQIIGRIRDPGGNVSNLLSVAATLAQPTWYFGESADIDPWGSSGTGYLRSLASAGTGNG
jgi:hypothetical protein